MKDYYYILGVDSSDTFEVIRKAYRKLSQKFHPDKNASDEFFENRFKEINEAYEILSDSTRRSTYDHLRLKDQSSNSQINNFIPIIKLFESDKQEFEYDKEITIRWKTVNADFVKLNPFGKVDPIGEKKYKIKSVENEDFKIELIATNTYNNESVKSILKIKNKTYQNFYKKVEDDFEKKNSKSKNFNDTNQNNFQILIPYRRGNKWGFCTVKKILMVDFIYDEVHRFQEGLAAVKKGNKWGYVGQTGAEIISCKYDSAFPFQEELGLIILNKKCGFINKGGEEVIPCIYMGATYFYSGLASVREYSMIQRILLKLKLVSKRLYLNWSIYTRDNNKSYKLIDKQNKQVFPEVYNSVGRFQEGYSAVKLKGKYGYIDNKGKMVIQPKFYIAHGFSEGLAAVKLFESYTAQRSAIFIDKEGNTKLCTKYNNVHSFRNGLALVETVIDHAIKYGFIDRNGKEVISCKYDSAGSFFEGLAYVGIGKVSDSRKFGFINKNDEITIPCKYQAAEDFKNNLAKVKFNKKYGFIDKNGTEYWED